jgi:hypothetical protein
MSTILTGHNPFHGKTGVDVLVTVWDDGSMEVALRDGRDERWRRWGPPAELVAETADAS